MARSNTTVDLAYAEALVPDVPGHTHPPPWPLHIHGSSYIVDEMCHCGKPRSQHEDTAQYGHGPSMDGTCPKFTWHGWIESAWPPARNKKAKPVVIPTKRSKK